MAGDEWRDVVGRCVCGELARGSGERKGVVTFITWLMT